MSRHLAAVMLWLLAAGAITTTAQGVSFVPSLDMSAMYDDNVFHRPAGEGDMIVRFSPRLDAVYRSERLALSSRYGLDADRFTRHPALTTAHGRQDASLDAHYDASRRLSMAAASSFTETQTPADLNDVTALTPGRARARRFMVRPSALYHLRPRTDASLEYTVTMDALSGGVGLTTQSATAALEHHLSAGDSLRVEFLDQQFLFTGFQASGSRALTAEWTRDVTRVTSLTLRAGPRVTGGALAPEIAASARHQMRVASLSASYLQTQTTLIGLAGLADARSISATAEGELRPRVRVTAGGGLLNTRVRDVSSWVYRVSASCAWTVSRRLAIEAGYDTDLQRGNLYTAQTAQNIGRRLGTVKLIVAPTAPVRRGRGSPWA